MVSVVQDREATLVPEVGSVVTCRVIKVNPRFAKVRPSSLPVACGLTLDPRLQLIFCL